MLYYYFSFSLHIFDVHCLNVFQSVNHVFKRGTKVKRIGKQNSYNKWWISSS